MANKKFSKKRADEEKEDKPLNILSIIWRVLVFCADGSFSAVFFFFQWVETSILCIRTHEGGTAVNTSMVLIRAHIHPPFFTD